MELAALPQHIHQPLSRNRDGQRGTPTNRSVIRMDAPPGLEAQLVKAARAICRVFGIDEQNKCSGVGTGFVVADGAYVVTAEHVVTRGTQCIVAFGGPSNWQAEATVVLTDPADDIALIRLDRRAASSLSFVHSGAPAAAGPHVCWEDDAAVGAAWVRESLLSLKVVGCLPLGIMRLRSLEGHERLGLAGAFRPGMSGGPVFAPLSGHVIGVVSAMPPYDPYSVVDAWADHNKEFENLSENLGFDVEDILKAQLGCGIGLAVPATVPINMLRSIGVDALGIT